MKKLSIIGLLVLEYKTKVTKHNTKYHGVKSHERVTTEKPDSQII